MFKQESEIIILSLNYKIKCGDIAAKIRMFFNTAILQVNTIMADFVSCNRSK